MTERKQGSTRKRTLKPRQEKFVQEYLKRGGGDGAGKASAIAAGYSPGSAHVAATRLLRRDEVLARMHERTAASARKAGITKDAIIGMNAEIVQASILDVLNDEGELDWKLVAERGTDHLIKKVRITERHSKDGSCRITREFEMYSRQEGLRELKEIMGLHKQPAKNPMDTAREMFDLLRGNPDYAVMSDDMLRDRVNEYLSLADTDWSQADAVQ